MAETPRKITMPIAEQWDGQTYYTDAIGRVIGHQETIVLANQLWHSIARRDALLRRWFDAPVNAEELDKLMEDTERELGDSHD